MRAAILLATSLTVALNGPLRADEQAQLKTLEKLLAEVRLLLPEDWETELSPLAENDPLEDVPVLVVRSKKPLRVRHFHPGLPGGVEGETTDPGQLETVELRFVCQPFISPRRYQELTLLNQQRERVREAFVKSRLQGMPWAHKGSPPLPPSAFNPSTDAERRAVREYQFLWLNTRPVELPTHYYRSLAFTLELDPGVSILDESQAHHYRRIQADVQQLILPYPTEGGSPRDTLGVPEDTGDATPPR